MEQKGKIQRARREDQEGGANGLLADSSYLWAFLPEAASFPVQLIKTSTMITFELKDHEFIELNKLLKILRLAGSGGEANSHIEQGEVLVNEAIETQKRKKLRPGDTVIFQDKSILIR
jgi:ribosome-associated protein